MAESNDELTYGMQDGMTFDKNGYVNMKFEASPVYPFDPTVGKYSLSMPPFMQPWEYNGWEKETMSWKKTCYISAELCPNSIVRIKGPDATEFLKAYTTNNYDNFCPGRIKHAVQPDENGMVQAHGMVWQTADDEYWSSSIGYWLMYYAEKDKGRFDVELFDESMDDFNLQCGGPRVLEMLEDACEEDLHDIKFMRFRESSIDGIPVIIMRFGMAGTLAYEVHGRMADARKCYEKVYGCGKKYGVERLGWLGYMSNHGENGFPQEGFHFQGAYYVNKDFLKWLESIGIDTDAWPLSASFKGSSGDKDLSKRFRNPVWLNWHNSINVETHDFIGKEAIAKELANPTMATKTLVWNVDDLVEVFKSMFQKDEEPLKLLEFPMEDASRATNTTQFQDDVLNADGEIVGWSSGREYSLYTRDMFSLATLKTEYCKDGTELYVLYGEPGERQMKIRAKVSHFPHLEDSMPLNKNFDIETIPHNWPKKH